MKKEELEWIRDYLDDRIDAERLDRLQRLLESDAAARAEFRALATMEEGLRDLAVAGEAPPASKIFPFSDSAESRARPWFRTEVFRIAASLVLLGGLAAFFLRGGGEEEWDDAVARIEFLGEGARFEPDHTLPREEGSLLQKGWLQLEQGRIRLRFRSGATVEAEGPVALGIDSPMRAYLDYGKVAVHAPGEARDFVVATESMEVVDLGTRFEVEVDPDSLESNVSVVEGLVDLHLGSRGAARTIRPLEAGYSARIDAFGKIVEITSRRISDAQTRTSDPELVGHWSFDGEIAGGPVPDSSGRGLDGRLGEGTRPEAVPGVGGKALAFSQGDCVDLRDHLSTLKQLDAFTLSAWVRDPRDPLAMIFSLSGESEQQRVQLYLAKGFVRYGWQDGPYFDSISGRVDGWEPGRWYHVALSVADGVAHLYRDGVPIASASIGAKLGTPVGTPSQVKGPAHAYLGRLEDGRQGPEVFAQGFIGQMDDVQLYSGALGQTAVRFLFENPGSEWKPEDQR